MSKKEKNLMVRPLSSPCSCVNVAMGSYDNQIILGYYPIMRGYQHRSVEAGSSSGYGICVDRCIAEEIIKLWEAGIMTFGCCCGHGEDEVAMINIKESAIDKLIDMGYEILEITADMREIPFIKESEASDE